MSSAPSSKQALDLLLLVQQLKLTKRTGWVQKSVKGPESIADHMYRMSIMAMVSCPPAVDRDRCIKMALVHDLAEAIVGDIPPDAGVSKEEKAIMEQDAMKEIKTMLGDASFEANEIEELFNEYECGETAEAMLVKDFDKLEMILQAHEYEQAQSMDLQEFFDSTEGRFSTPTGKALAGEVMARRAACKQGESGGS
eukprot:CAMPEP_0177773422 /NCGR_PEP_ID=MMETSP0491_2-20121128/12861_1 /TAXON_ID=63592 /ORGANISM="Tetraselmis chuii, Strain PLY429" /LENGTH=195 /DNA_ID=CAMNT_0019291525 /DNA_START=211 /DNA_END=798 /DNA_ORIENTATION=+